ncbi:MAG: hypothetical protein AAGJ35_06615, partial [Myxococcota bacterium]
KNQKNYWTSFEHPFELRAALQQAPTQTLLSPFSYWRVEQTSSNESNNIQGLLHTRYPLPETGGTPLARIPKLSLKKPSQEIDLFLKPRNKVHVHAQLLSAGDFLFTAMGLEDQHTTPPPAWVLYQCPYKQMGSLITEHLMLDNQELRTFHDPQQDVAWILSLRPELFLLLKKLEHPAFQIYTSTPESPQYFAPYGKQPKLRPKLPQSDQLFVQESNTSLHVHHTQAWWTAQEVMHIVQLPQSHTPPKSPLPPPKIDIQLRYLPAESTTPPRLWRIDQPDVIEQLFFTQQEKERSALYVAIVQEQQHTFFLLQDHRPNNQTPLLSGDQAIGFMELLPQHHFFLESGFRIVPQLPAHVLHQLFDLQMQQLTLLQISASIPHPIDAAEDIQTPIFYALPQTDFMPLSSYVQYNIHAHQTQIRQQMKHISLDILFTPPQLELKSPAPKPKKAQRAPSAKVTAAPPQRDNPKKHLKQLSSDPKEELLKLESKLRTRAQRGDYPLSHEWLQLADLYFQKFTQTQDTIALQESLKALDQILYLEHQDSRSLQLERMMLEEALKTTGMSFEESMQRLDHLIHQQRNELQQRMGFRLRCRLLLSTHDQDEDRQLLLRLQFYKDLAHVEPVLMIREHYICVESCAKMLQDQELYERTRTRFRKALEK